MRGYKECGLKKKFCTHSLEKVIIEGVNHSETDVGLLCNLIYHKDNFFILSRIKCQTLNNRGKLRFSLRLPILDTLCAFQGGLLLEYFCHVTYLILSRLQSLLTGQFSVQNKHRARASWKLIFCYVHCQTVSLE